MAKIEISFTEQGIIKGTVVLRYYLYLVTRDSCQESFKQKIGRFQNFLFEKEKVKD